MTTIEPLDVKGEPRARGRAIGAALGPRIRAHLTDWLGSLPAGGDGRGYIADMLRTTDFRTALRQHAPDLLEECEGIAEGAGEPADLVFALQLLDEEWAWRLTRPQPAAKLEKCSSLAIVPGAGGPTWIGQNMDLGAYTEGHQVLLRIAGHGRAPGALVFSVAGMIGLMGVNAAGVGVCVNSIPQLPSAPEGVPVAFVLRRLLQARSLAEAAEVVLAIPHATNQHYVIAEAGAARSFEAGAMGVTEHRPQDPTRVLHTNHPLSDAVAAPETDAARANSAARLAALRARLSDGAPGLAEIQAALSSCDDRRHPICRIAGEDGGLVAFTTGSMISALTPGGAESWISPGPPSVRGYTAVAVEAGG